MWTEVYLRTTHRWWCVQLCSVEVEWQHGISHVIAGSQTLARIVEGFPELNPTHEIVVLSMGAGDVETNVNMDDNPNADWGLQQWGYTRRNCLAWSTEDCFT